MVSMICRIASALLWFNSATNCAEADARRSQHTANNKTSASGKQKRGATPHKQKRERSQPHQSIFVKILLDCSKSDDDRLHFCETRIDNEA